MKREWLIQIRKNKNVTQEFISSAAFIDRSYYSQIERGNRNPSISVAHRISVLLDFDPMMFFKDSENHLEAPSTINYSIEDTNPNIRDFIKNSLVGETLYINEDLDKYIINAVTFIFLRVKKGNYCLILDNQAHLSSIHSTLKTILSKTELNYVYFIDTKEHEFQKVEMLLPYLQVVLSKLDDQPISIWGNQWEPLGDLFGVFKPFLYSKLHNSNIFFLGVYNALKVSAGTYTSMLRKYQYLMTDIEIVQSPLYGSSGKTNIYPSFYIQDD